MLTNRRMSTMYFKIAGSSSKMRIVSTTHPSGLSTLRMFSEARSSRKTKPAILGKAVEPPILENKEFRNGARRTFTPTKVSAE
jgi:hypothetical protein